MSIARTPEPPYWAVIFSSQRRVEDDPGYQRMAGLLGELAPKQPGFLGLETARDADGLGITVSYWRALDDISAWKHDARHLEAQRAGRGRWYADYALRIAHVVRDYTLASSPLEGI